MKTGGDGGVIGLDNNGNISMEFNTAGMYRASIDKNGNLTVKIYSDWLNGLYTFLSLRFINILFFEYRRGKNLSFAQSSYRFL